MDHQSTSPEDLIGKARQINDPAQRQAFLIEACAGNPRTMAEVLMRMLQANSVETPTQIEAPPKPEAGTTAVDSGVGLEEPGALIGRYKLLEKLGEGGFGEVWAAEQTEPMRRRVALKIIKLGMDTKQVIARFEAERQALALMDHPNIAKVLDAGSTETGRPYFVMELVKGIPITEYCDQEKLDTPARLELFATVCQAIHHAHQKGIIHRDIKPDNILVTLSEGKPMPKVIDFGIAKATQMELTEKSVYTQLNQFLGTPAYMSPEQAEMSGLDIDTRSDIYSLGVLLYELLTRRRPFESKALLEAGLDGMRRIIREQEPPRPSTKIETLDEQERLTVAARRGSNPQRLISMIRGDLDWITIRCLEKDRTRRYETVNGLARDVQRHLIKEPVTARPPSRAYRIERFVRRNRLAVTAGTLIILTVLSGLGVSTWLLILERDARQRAVAAEQTEMQLRKEAEVRYLSEAAFGRWNRGETDQAEQSFWELLNLQRSTLGSQSTNVAITLRNLGHILTFQGKSQEAEPLYREAVEIWRQVETDGTEAVATGLDYLAECLNQRGDVFGAERACREALEIRLKLYPENHERVASTYASLAALLGLLQKQHEADRVFDRLTATQMKGRFSLVQARATLCARSARWPEAVSSYSELITLQPDYSFFWLQLAQLFVQTGDLDAYRAHCEAMVARFGSAHSPHVAEWVAKACLILPESGIDLRVLQELAERGLDVSQDNPYLGYRYLVRGLADYRSSHFREASLWLRRSFEVGRARRADAVRRDAQGYSILAMCLHQMGQEEEAKEALLQAARIIEHQLPPVGKADLGEEWMDILLANTLFREAEALLARVNENASPSEE